MQHCEDHGISKNEVEEVLDNLDDLDISRSSGHPIVFGETNSGRYLMVVFEVVDEDTIYPITAYEVDKRLDP
ncbi:MAG: hypothetical protein FLDDKLPJ_03032 [Phycisphaerae bacterium]|nr:hypothetical protein [Phycisphaerae bacterium]